MMMASNHEKCDLPPYVMRRIRSLLFVFLTVTFTVAQSETEHSGELLGLRTNIEQEHATMELFRELLSDYDRRIRPYFATGRAAMVTVDFYLASFDSIRESHMDFSVTLYLRQRWHDPRLEYDPSITLPTTSYYMDDIWLPDLIISNAKNARIPMITMPNKWVHINSSGHVLYNMRISLQLSCAMDFHRFPLDHQSCDADFESFENPIEDVHYRWNEEDPVEYHKDLLKLPQYEVDGVHVHNCTKKLKTGVYSCIGADFLFRRTLGYYLLQTYIPSTLLVVTSFLSFWIQIKASPARVALGVTTVLTMITTNNGVRADLPKVSYIKAIDVWFAACFAFVIGALIEYALAHYLSYNKVSFQVLFSSLLHSKTDRTPNVPNNVETDRQTCMVLTIEDTPEDENMGGVVDDFYNRNYRDTPEAEQGMSMGALTNYGINTNELQTISGQQTQNSSTKLCIKGKCQSKNNGGAPVYDAGKRMDRLCRVIFPFSFFVFNICYWSYYVTKFETPSHSFVS